MKCFERDWPALEIQAHIGHIIRNIVELLLTSHSLHFLLRNALMVRWDRDFSCFLSSVWYFNLHNSQKFWIGRPRPPRYLFSIIICLLWMFVSFLCRTLRDWRAWPNFLQTICRPPGVVTNSIHYSLKENLNHQSTNCNILHYIVCTSCGEMLWWSNETEMPNDSSHQFGISVCTSCKSFGS